MPAEPIHDSDRVRSPADFLRLIVAAVTLLVVLVATALSRGMLRRLAVLLGVVAGWACAALTGQVDQRSMDAVADADWFGAPQLLAPQMHLSAVPFVAPMVLVLVAELVGVYYTGGSLNPARSFGPCVVTGIFDVEHWIYWVGPGLGAVVALVFYQFIKMLEYEVANPGQDDDDKDELVKEKVEEEGRDQAGMGV